MPKGGLEPPRLASYAPQTYVSTNSTTSAYKTDKTGFSSSPYFLAGEADGEAAGLASLASDEAAGLAEALGDASGLALADGDAAGEAAGLGAVIGCEAGALSPTTELTPNPGIENISARNMKIPARIAVAFSRGFCGPRGPNADCAPPPPKAPATSPPLPDCSNTARIKKMHVRTKMTLRM